MSESRDARSGSKAPQPPDLRVTGPGAIRSTPSCCAACRVWRCRNATSPPAACSRRCGTSGRAGRWTGASKTMTSSILMTADLSWAAEDRVIRQVNALTADLGVTVEVKNQARVHLWYRDRFQADYPQLQSAQDGIDRFPVACTCVGIEVATGCAVCTPWVGRFERGRAAHEPEASPCGLVQGQGPQLPAALALAALCGAGGSVIVAFQRQWQPLTRCIARPAGLISHDVESQSRKYRP